MGDSEEEKELFEMIDKKLLKKEIANKTQKSIKQLHINFGAGLVSDPFTGKDGKDYVQIKVPNKKTEDESRWATFVLPAYKIMINETSNSEKKGVYIYLPEDGNTTLRKDLCINVEGKKEWKHEIIKVSNKELKKMLESYKQRNTTIESSR